MINNLIEAPVRSVSGIRAIIGETASAYTFCKYAYTLGKIYGKSTVIVGRDTRKTGEEIKKAVFSGLIASGCTPIDIGICPTPTTGFITKTSGANFGIMISASHNPSQWNAIKLMHKEGRHFNEEEVNELFKAYDETDFSKIDFPEVDLDNIKVRNTVKEEHINEILKHIDLEAIRSKKYRVAVDLINGAGVDIIPMLFKELNLDGIYLNTQTNGEFNHEPTPTPENLTELSKTVKEKSCDIGFAVDPDADRLAIVLPTGEAISEEYTLCLVVDYLTDSHKEKTVVTNLSATMLHEDICNNKSVALKRSKVGEANVVEMMKEEKSIIGGEGNGGVIYTPVVFVRDSLMGMAFILNIMASREKKIEDIISSYPKYYMEKQKINCEREKMDSLIDKLAKHYQNQNLEVDIRDGIRIVFDKAWLGIRKSNTENIIRFFSEALNKDEAATLVNDAMNLAKEIDND